jgi:hypothetical protein
MLGSRACEAKRPPVRRTSPSARAGGAKAASIVVKPLDRAITLASSAGATLLARLCGCRGQGNRDEVAVRSAHDRESVNLRSGA